MIAIHRPRAVGKSTVLTVFAAARRVPVLDLDDLTDVSRSDGILRREQLRRAHAANCSALRQSRHRPGPLVTRSAGSPG